MRLRSSSALGAAGGVEAWKALVDEATLNADCFSVRGDLGRGESELCAVAGSFISENAWKSSVMKSTAVGALGGF